MRSVTNSSGQNRSISTSANFTRKLNFTRKSFNDAEFLRFLIKFYSRSQTASLFYDQIKINDNDIPSLFQSFSHCFVGPQSYPLTNPSPKASKYRSIDGSDNNLKRTLWGASHTAFGRILKAQYDDNIHSVRRSIRGYVLPSPRNIVRKIFYDGNTNYSKFKDRTRIPNMAALIFGQYIAHDVSARHQAQYVDGGNGKHRCNLTCFCNSLQFKTLKIVCQSQNFGF